MTTKPTIQTARVDGYTVTAPDWNTNIIQEDNYAFEVIAGTNTDKIAVGSLANVQGYYPNLLVNGGFEVWNRGNGPFSGNVVHADQWRTSLGGGSTMSVSAGGAWYYNSNFMATGTYVHGTGSGPIGYVYQNLEVYPELIGRTVTFSAYLYAPSNTGMYLQLGDGVSGANSNRAVAGTPTLCTVTYAVNAGATVLQCSIIFDASNANWNADNVMLIEGNVPSLAFVATPMDIEQQRCARYWQRAITSNRYRASSTGDFRDTTVVLPTRMYAVPTVTVTAGTRANIAAATPADIFLDGFRYELQPTAANLDTYAIEDACVCVATF